MFLGKVKWFDNKKGFGFIIPLDENEKENGDVFIHHKRIEKNGFKTLKEDQLVSYTKEDTENGVMATTVQIIETSNYEAMENVISEILLINIDKEKINKQIKELSYIITQLLINEKVSDNTIIISKEKIIEKIDYDFLKRFLENESANTKTKKSIEIYLEKYNFKNHEDIIEIIKKNI